MTKFLLKKEPSVSSLVTIGNQNLHLLRQVVSRLVKTQEQKQYFDSLRAPQFLSKFYHPIHSDELFDPTKKRLTIKLDHKF